MYFSLIQGFKTPKIYVASKIANKLMGGFHEKCAILTMIVPFSNFCWFTNHNVAHRRLEVLMFLCGSRKPFQKFRGVSTALHRFFIKFFSAKNSWRKNVIFWRSLKMSTGHVKTMFFSILSVVLLYFALLWEYHRTPTLSALPLPFVYVKMINMRTFRKNAISI